MDIIIAKVIAMALLGGISLLLGFLPLKLGSLIETTDSGGGRRHFWKRTITSVLLCYGGGVLLATSFVHMLPEVRQVCNPDNETRHLSGESNSVYKCHVIELIISWRKSIFL